jgi:hypothetical protein
MRANVQDGRNLEHSEGSRERIAALKQRVDRPSEDEARFWLSSRRAIAIRETIVICRKLNKAGCAEADILEESVRRTSSERFA